MDLIYIECDGVLMRRSSSPVADQRGITRAHSKRVNIVAAEYRDPGWRLIAVADNRLESWIVSANGTPLFEHSRGTGRQLVRRSKRLPMLENAHQRYGLICPRCRRRVTVGAERLAAVLEVLRHADEESITLTELEARLRNS